MKLCAAVIFCVFWGMAFSQDTSFVLLPQDSISAVKDSVVKNSIVENMVDTTSIDTTFNPFFIDTALTDSAKIKPGLRFFVSAGLQFINFKESSKFQALLDAEYEKYDYPPLRQDFETVNLTFPISAGIIWQFSDVHSLGLGVIFLYDNESVILTEWQDTTHNFKYTLQAFPVFVEYRLLVSPKLITLKNNDYFSLFLRYYWLLPPTRINSSWGNAKADFEPLGNGYGIFLGYRFWEWEGLSVFGEMGYLSLDAKSSTKNGILNSWNLGGITVLVRALF
jgi:hypothetical protein